MKDLSELTILSAENFTNIELRKRLEKMDVKVSNNLKRKDLTKLYNEEVVKSDKITNIQELIEKDLDEIDQATTNIIENPFKKSKISTTNDNNKLKEKREQYKSQKNSEVVNSGDKNKVLNDHLKVNEKFINDYLKNMGDTKNENARSQTNGSKNKVVPIISIDSSEDANAVNNKINNKSTNLFTTTNRSKNKEGEIGSKNTANKPFTVNEIQNTNNSTNVPQRKGREETMKKFELKIRGDKNEKLNKMDFEKEKKESSSLDKNIFTNNASSALKNMLGLSNDKTKENRNSMSINKEDLNFRETRDNKRLEDGLIGEKSIKFNLGLNNDHDNMNGASALMETINKHLQAKEKSINVSNSTSTNKVLLNRSKLNEKNDATENLINNKPNDNLVITNDRNNNMNVSKEKKKLENNPLNNDYLFSDQFSQFKNQFAKDFENINKDKSQSRFSNQERSRFNIDNNFKKTTEENISIHSNNYKSKSSFDDINKSKDPNNNNNIKDNDNIDAPNKTSYTNWRHYLLLGGGIALMGYYIMDYISNHDTFIEQDSNDNHLYIRKDLNGDDMNDDTLNNNSNTNMKKGRFNTILSIIYSGVTTLNKSKDSLIYYITNPEKIFNDIGSTLYLMGTEFLLNNWHYILVAIALMLILFYIKKWYMARSIANESFNEIRTELRNMYNTSNINYDDGIYEEQIVIRFSDRYNLSDEYFRNSILPLINEYRKKDPQIKVFTKKKNGILQNVWQWI